MCTFLKNRLLVGKSHSESHRAWLISSTFLSVTLSIRYDVTVLHNITKEEPGWGGGVLSDSGSSQH